MFPAEGLYSRSLSEVPDSNCFVFSARYDQFVLGVEDSAWDIVEVATACVDLPRLQVTHPPQFDLPVIRSRNDEGEGWVEDSIVDTTVMTFQDILDRWEVVECVECAGGWIGCTFTQTRDIPYPDGLIHGCGHDKVFLGMEEGWHYIVRMASENGYAVAGRAVPYTNRLVIWTGDLRDSSE
jgi:hypothetical protein